MNLSYKAMVGLRYFKDRSLPRKRKRPLLGALLVLLFGGSGMLFFYISEGLAPYLLTNERTLVSILLTFSALFGFFYYSFERVLIWQFLLAVFTIAMQMATGEAPSLQAYFALSLLMAISAYLDLKFVFPKYQRSISLRTYVSAQGIILGVGALIGTLGIMTGFKEDLQSKILGTTSHILVHDRVHDNMSGYAPLIAKAEQVPHVMAATPFIFRQVLLSSQSGVQGIVLRGIDAGNEVRVTELAKNIKSGNLDHLEHPELTVRLERREEGENRASDPEAEPAKEPGKVYPGIILGKELAMRLTAFVGDQVNVVSPVGNVNAVTMIPKIRVFTVVAIFQSGMYEYDSSLAYIALKEAQQFFNMGETVTGIEVKVDDIFQANAIARSIEYALGLQYWARDWMQLNRNLFSALKLEKTMMFLLLVLITLVASFNIVSTLTMIVTEKQREIAILKAMGATRGAILQIFMFHGVIIGALGIIIGMPLGYTFLSLIETHYTFDQTVYYIKHIPVHVQGVDVLVVSLTVIIISFLATLLPSWRGAKLDPAAALRYE